MKPIYGPYVIHRPVTVSTGECLICGEIDGNANHETLDRAVGGAFLFDINVPLMTIDEETPVATA